MTDIPWKRIALIVLMLAMPVAAFTVGVSSTDDLNRPNNYSIVLSAESFRCGEQVIYSLVDYSDGEGKIMLLSANDRGELTGFEHVISRRGRDCFHPMVHRTGDDIMVIYLSATECPYGSRSKDTVRASVNLLSLDPETLSPAGPVENGKEIGTVHIDSTWRSHFKSGKRMYALLDLGEGGFDPPGEHVPDGFRISRNISGDHSVSRQDPEEIEGSILSVSVCGNGSVKTAVISHETDNIIFHSMQEGGVWGGIGMITMDDPGDGKVFTTLSNPETGTIRKWEAEWMLDNGPVTASVTGSGIYLFDDQPAFSFLPYDGNTTFNEMNTDNRWHDLMDVVIDQNGDIITFYDPGFSGDNGVIRATISNGTANYSAERFYLEIFGADMVPNQDGSQTGVARTGSGTGYSISTVRSDMTGIHLVDEIGSTSGGGMGSFMLLGFAPVIIGMAVFVMNLHALRLKQFRKMTREQLRLMDIRHLRKALGEKREDIDREELMDMILEPRGSENISSEEFFRRMRLQLLPFIYFATIGLGALSLFGNLFFDRPLNPIFFPGPATPLETISLTIILALMVYLLSDEWKISKTRRWGLLIMISAMVVGQLYSLILLIISRDPSVGFSTFVQTFTALSPSLVVIGLFGPLVILADRTGKRKLLFFGGLFAWYFVTTIILMILHMARTTVVPTGTGMFVYALQPLLFTGLLTYMMIGMLGGMTIMSMVSMDYIKPSGDWRMEELTRMRTPPLVLAMVTNLGLGAAFFGLTLDIPMNSIDITGSALILGLSLVIVILSAGMYVTGIVTVKKLKSDLSNLTQGMMMSYFVPLMTTMCGLIYGLVLSYPAVLFFTFVALGQIVYADRTLISSFRSISAQNSFRREKGAQKIGVKYEKKGKKKEEKIRVKKELFLSKLGKTIRGLWVLLVVMIGISFLANLYGSYLLEADIQRIVPDPVLLVVFLIVFLGTWAYTFPNISRSDKKRSVMHLANAALLQPFMVVFMVGTILSGFLIQDMSSLLLMAALAGIPYILMIRIYSQKAREIFSNLGSEERMLYPSEIAVMRSGFMGITNPDQLEAKTREVKREHENSNKTRSKIQKDVQGQKKDRNIPEKDERGQLERGDYLFMETPRLLRLRTSGNRKAGTVLLILSGIVLVLGASVFLMDMFCGIISLAVFGFFCIILMSAGLVTLLGKGGKKPIRFHEWGYVDHSLAGGKEIFVPYGNLRVSGEKAYPVFGRIRSYKALNISTIWLPVEKEPFSELVEKIERRIGKEEHKGFIENSAGTTGREVVLPLISLFLSVAGSALFAVFVVFTQDLAWPLGLMAFSAGLMAFSLTYMNTSDKQKKVELSRGILRPERKGCDIRTVITVTSIAAGIVIAVIGVVLVITVPGSIITQDHYPRKLPEVYDDIISFREGETHIIDTALVIRDGQEVSFRDTCFIFRGASEEPAIFYVEEEGEANLENVTFTSEGTSRVLSVEIHGNSLFRDCTFDGIWADGVNTNGNGGVEVYNCHAEFEECSFLNGSYNLFMSVGADVTLEDCLFRNSGDDALEIKDSRASVDSCHIDQCAWAMVIYDGSNVDVTDSSVTNSTHGIANSRSEVTVSDTKFENIETYAIQTGYGADVEMENNRFENVGSDFQRDAGAEEIMLGFCSTTPFLVAILAVILLVVKLRKRKKEMKER